MTGSARHGTEKKQGNAPARPVPGDATLDRADVAPARRGNWIIWIIPAILLIGLAAGIWLLAQPSVTVIDRDGGVILDDDVRTGGDLGG